jgi:hypothetical protein
MELLGLIISGLIIRGLYRSYKLQQVVEAKSLMDREYFNAILNGSITNEHKQLQDHYEKVVQDLIKKYS